MQKQTGSAMRLACLVAVLLASSAWQCLAEEPDTTDAEATPVKRTKAPKLQPPKYSAEHLPETLHLAETAQRFIVLAESANNLSADAIKQVQELRARAEAAVTAAKNTAAEAEAVAKKKSTSVAARTAARDAKLAAEIAQELHGNATANPTLIEEHAKWYSERHDEAKKLVPALAAAVAALEKSKDTQGDDMTQLVNAVLTPARSIFKLAQNAENDAKHIAQKRLYTELLAERVEIMSELAKQAMERAANGSDSDAKESCNNADHQEDSTGVSHHHDAAAKAYLYAVSARKIAVRCILRISQNATKVEEMYYAVKGLLAKAKEADYKTLRVYHSIADEARTNAEDSKRVAASASENAAMYANEARSALESISSCASKEEAQWYITVARRASHKALSEAHLAMHQLFMATVSLQQITDATSAVESNKNTETDNSITDPKEKAIESEKKAEASYIRVKTDADEADDKLHRAEEIVKQIKRLAAHYGRKDVTATIEEHLQTAKTAVRAARASSKQAHRAASSVYAHYDDAKTAADSALGAFLQKDVKRFETAAAEAATATQESEETNAPKAKQAFEKVTQQEQKAAQAYKETKQVVAEVRKTSRRKRE